MDTIKSISFRAVGMGLLFGYLTPYLLFKLMLYIMYCLGVSGFSGFFSYLLLAVPLFFSPTISGYLGAKHSSKMPVLNGALATLAGVIFFFIVSEPSGFYMYLVMCLLAFACSYAGSRRFIIHG